MTRPHRRAATGALFAATLALAAARPAEAQQYWLPNGSGGTTFNNPQGSLLGTANERMLQRHMEGRRNGPGTPAAASAGSAAPARTRDPSFRLSNPGAAAINEVYVSSAQDSGWGADRLGRNVLPAGQAMVIRLPEGQCVNDVRVVYADGRATERRGVDTCALTDLALP